MMSLVLTGNPQKSLSRFKLFLALSRTPHGILDIATPAMTALLWYAGFPSLKVISIGILTAFAGYTAVYALNDLVDYHVDKEKILKGTIDDSDSTLDSLFVRHPIARGLITLKEGRLWTILWGALAVIGAFLLNPFCVLIFLGGCILEIIYCLLFRYHWGRTFISGMVKTSGGLAAVFAVDQSPSISFLIIIFLWISLWEIGGQNLPNDLIDIEEDKNLKAKTVATRFGRKKTIISILMSLILSVLLSLISISFSPSILKLFFAISFLIIGSYLLIFPAVMLYKYGSRSHAMFLFDRSSYYPLAILIVVATGLFLFQ